MRRYERETLIRPALAADAHSLAVVHVSAWQKAYRGIVPTAHLEQLSISDREARWAGILERGE